jgi:uncharacterized protein (TIGR03086 family)
MDVDPVALFERATARAAAVMARVDAGQLRDPTPCAEWTVQQLIDHMVGSTDYLAAALAGREPGARSGASVDDYRLGARRVLEGLREPGAMARTCVSPLGFTWTIGEATAGTFMDNLIHTWDLATATNQDCTLDGELVDACAAMFLPEMPERGRAAGLVGPAFPVPADATAQDRLLGAMGRRPVIPEVP